MLSEREFEQLFKTYYKPCVSISKAYTKNISIAEEVVQDVFVNLWQKKEQQTAILNMEAYIKKAVVYRSLSAIKKEHKYAHQEDYDILTTIQDIKGNDPESRMIHKEEHQEVQRLVHNLPNKTREIFMLSRMENMTYREIEQQTGIHIKSIEYHMSKALQILRKALFSLMSWILFIQ